LSPGATGAATFRGYCEPTAALGRFFNLEGCNMKNQVSKLMGLGTLVVLMAAGCLNLSPCRNDLQIARRNLAGQPIKTNGYFYGNPIDGPPTYVSLSYFYLDGVFLASGATLREAESGLLRPSPDFPRNRKPGWGVFLVNNRNIEIERWEEMPYGACEINRKEIGEVLNDTTFIITRLEFWEKGKLKKREEVNWTFRFRPQAQKPDSTNNFIQ
jgi:hypothetical protein